MLRSREMITISYSDRTPFLSLASTAFRVAILVLVHPAALLVCFLRWRVSWFRARLLIFMEGVWVSSRSLCSFGRLGSLGSVCSFCSLGSLCPWVV